MSKKLKYEDVKNYIESFGYRLLSEEYKNNKTKLKIKCGQGHYFEMKFNDFKSGHRCPVCYGNKKLSYDEIKSYIESFGYQLLSKKYKNNLDNLKVQCPKGHIYEVNYNNFKSGYRCPYCAKNAKPKIKKIKKYIESFGYQLLSGTYKNSQEKLEYRCPKGHSFEMSWNNFQRGQRCPVCNSRKYSSKAEEEIFDFIKSIYNGNISRNNRKIIKNPITKMWMELDIYLTKPKLSFGTREKKAIEFNGTYWHSFPDKKEKDKIKKLECEKNNIKLLVINENDWISNKEKCLNEIKNFIYK